VRVTRLFEELKIAHADGSFMRRLNALAKTDLLILDDFAMAAIGSQDRLDLLEILDDRVSSRACSRLPTKPGTPTSTTPRSPTPFSIASCTRLTSWISRESRYAKTTPKINAIRNRRIVIT
jgi:hypothetical protein